MPPLDTHLLHHGVSPAPARRELLSDTQILKHFLSLSPDLRRRHFADTSAVASQVGLSRRTIQLWIEVGSIRAVRVGRRYQVVLASVYGYLEAIQEDA